MGYQIYIIFYKNKNIYYIYIYIFFFYSNFYTPTSFTFTMSFINILYFFISFNHNLKFVFVKFGGCWCCYCCWCCVTKDLKIVVCLSKFSDFALFRNIPKPLYSESHSTSCSSFSRRDSLEKSKSNIWSQPLFKLLYIFQHITSYILIYRK